MPSSASTATSISSGSLPSVGWRSRRWTTASGPGPTNYLPGPGYGFGIGFAVRRQEGVATEEGSPGDYYWLGAAGTSFWNDPKQHLTVVFMMQAPSQLLHYSALLRNMVYGALTEPEK
jgi:CubicO group peptidase (beta-lactamase class C family)